MDERENLAAREWIMRQLRSGERPATLHEMVDQVASGVLVNSIEAERRARHQIIKATAERDEAIAEAERLRSIGAALAETGKERQDA